MASFDLVEVIKQEQSDKIIAACTQVIDNATSFLVVSTVVLTNAQVVLQCFD